MREGVSSKAIAFASTILILALTFVLLIEGRDLLIPIAVSVMIWYLINALARGFHLIPIGSYRIPISLSMALAIATLIIGLTIIAELISDNIGQVSLVANTYQANIEILISKASTILGLNKPPDIAAIFEQIDLRSLATRFLSATASFAGSFG